MTNWWRCSEFHWPPVISWQSDTMNNADDYTVMLRATALWTCDKSWMFVSNHFWIIQSRAELIGFHSINRNVGLCQIFIGRQNFSRLFAFNEIFDYPALCRHEQYPWHVTLRCCLFALLVANSCDVRPVYRPRKTLASSHSTATKTLRPIVRLKSAVSCQWQQQQQGGCSTLTLGGCR